MFGPIPLKIESFLTPQIVQHAMIAAFKKNSDFRRSLNCSLTSWNEACAGKFKFRMFWHDLAIFNEKMVKGLFSC